MVAHPATTPRLKAVSLPFNISTVGLFVLLVFATLLAIQIRLQVTQIGKPILEGYQPHPPMLYALLALSVLLVETAAAFLPRGHILEGVLGEAHPARRFLIILALSTVAILVLLPDISQLQMVYYFAAGLVLTFLTIMIPRRIYVGHYGNDLGEDMRKLVKAIPLYRLWLSSNIRSRYTNTALGVLWIILLPLATSLVLALAFRYFLRIQMSVPFVPFFLTGLVPYNLFATGVLRSTEAILAKLGLITQVYFPREILVFLLMGEFFVDFIFTFATMLVINLFYGIVPNIYFVYIPLLVVLIILIALGIMLMIACFSVLVRDVPQLIGVFMQLFFYLTPVIYPVENFPQEFRFLFVINPIAPLVQAFRDVIIFNRAPDLLSLVYPLVFGCVMLYLGYAIFKSIEGRMADML